MCVIPFVIPYEVKERDILLYRQSRKRGKNTFSSFLAYNYRTNPSIRKVKMCYQIIVKEICFIFIEFLSVY